MVFTLQDIGDILSGLYRDLRKSIEQRGRKIDETIRRPKKNSSLLRKNKDDRRLLEPSSMKGLKKK